MISPLIKNIRRRRRLSSVVFFVFVNKSLGLAIMVGKRGKELLERSRITKRLRRLKIGRRYNMLVSLITLMLIFLIIIIKSLNGDLCLS
jgi:archaellum biogenesis protein FlaJ (TadC family)